VGRAYSRITPAVAAWLGAQQMFFVATAPAEGGHVNVSPKGLDTFRVLGASEVRFLDLTGSGVETIAHLRENGRITLMFCAFEGEPRIVRISGTGRAVLPGDEAFEEMASDFPARRGARAVVVVQVDRVADSCGFGVPMFQFLGQRTRLAEWADDRSDEELARYREEHNAVSIDGLPGLPAAPPDEAGAPSLPSPG
jgi:Pyridoxamine 5'-phosphate oxidase